MSFHSFKMNLKSYKNCDQEEAIMNRSVIIVSTQGSKREKYSFGLIPYCFHDRLQGSTITENTTHVAGDPGSCCWKHWPVR